MALVALLCAFSLGVVLNIAGGVFIPLVVAWLMLQIFKPVINLGKMIKVPQIVNLIIVFSVLFSVCYIGIVFCSTQVVEFNKAYLKYHDKISELSLDIMKVLQIPPESLPRISWMDFLSRYMRNISEVVIAISSKFVLTLIFFMFLLLEFPFIDNKIDMAFSGNNAAKIKKIMSSVSHETSRYLGALTLISLATGICVWAVLGFMDVELAVGWGVLAFLLNFIPTVGSIIATIPPVLMAVLQFSPDYIKPCVVLLLLSIIQIGIGNFITPKIVGDSLGLSPVVILLSLLLWGMIWGIPGAILAVPIAAIIKIVCENFESLKPIAVIMGSGKPILIPHETLPEKKEESKRLI